MSAADEFPPECNEDARKWKVREQIESQKERACESDRKAEGIDTGILVSRLARLVCVSIDLESKNARKIKLKGEKGRDKKKEKRMR